MIQQKFDVMRQSMVASQLRTTSVSDERVVAAMRDVPREDFVPKDSRLIAYADAALPIGQGRALPAPMALGRMLTEAAISPTDHVLVIGAGLGYAAAVVAQLAGSVVALEEAQFAASLRAAFAEDDRVTVIEGKLNEGAATQGLFDLIVVDGAIEFVPDSLAAQVKPGGRLVTGLVDQGVARLAIGREAGGQIGLVSFCDADVPVLPGFLKPKQFSF